MSVNLEKSASQAFSLTHETFRPELQYQNTSISNTDSFTYLGVTFDNKHGTHGSHVGAGVFSHFFSFNAPAGFIGTAFDGEEVAIRIALKQLLAIHHKFENAVLLSDSQATIQSISSFELPLTPEISHCQELLSTLTLKGNRIVLQWVPGHCGLWGNEQADFLGKRGANLLQHPNTATSYWKIKLFLKNLCTSNSLWDLQTRTALKSWRRVSPSSIADKPRHDAVAAFRLTTGHDCLAAHLHLLGIYRTF
ncbi:hypothetical protein AVEN_3446-1 [Araneus ventricosus]|uniref:RNase H type-1 domain-containing protein n=1 Tax=Araneus ventricosus TaxID=182803 RepID=A0A4Y2QR16_ARAVE|nr:hypothetical protein AVEN_3446-1 [Araneus ventricosus]